MKNQALIAELKRKVAELPKVPSEAFDILVVKCQKCCDGSNGGNNAK